MSGHPYAPENDSPPPQQQRQQAQRQARPAKFAAGAAALPGFLAMLKTRHADLRQALPDHVKVEDFVRAAVAAVTRNPALLDPQYGDSLMIAIQRAAEQSLLPNGREGVLLPRWNGDTKRVEVCWQPMVWGIAKLGRQTGEIAKWSANLVWRGEPYDSYLENGEWVIKHRKLMELSGPDIEAGIVGAYCVITKPDGTTIARDMPAWRIWAVRDTAKGDKTGGPWFGPFKDEMALKTVMLYTFKWLDTNLADTDALRRFRAAIMQDMEVDFDALTEPGAASALAAPGAPAPAARRALAAPGARLANLEAQIAGFRQEVAEAVLVSGKPAETGKAEPSKAAEAKAVSAEVAEIAAQLIREGRAAKLRRDLARWQADPNVLGRLNPLRKAWPEVWREVTASIDAGPEPRAAAAADPDFPNLPDEGRFGP